MANSSTVLEILRRIDVMDQSSLSSSFKALGDPTRLKIFECLRCCCEPVAIEETGEMSSMKGATVGEVCCTVTGLDKITSTISFHLKELRNAGLITMERNGKHMICRINPEKVSELSAYLSNETSGASCC